MIKKVLIVLAVVVGLALLGFAGLIGYLLWNEEALKERFLVTVNEQLTVPLETDEIDIDFWSQFPDLSLRLDHVFIEDPLRLESGDTLLYFESSFAQFELFSVLSGETVIRRITLENGQVNLRWQEDGLTNFDILKDDSSDPESYMDLQGLQVKNTKVSLSGDGKNPWHIPFVAREFNLKGVLDAERFDAMASWEILVPEWNNQSVQIKGSMNFQTNSEEDRIVVHDGQLNVNSWELSINGEIENGSGHWKAQADNLDMSSVIPLLPQSLLPDPNTITVNGSMDLTLEAQVLPSGTRIIGQGDWKNGTFNASNGWIMGEEVSAHIDFDNGSPDETEPSLLRISEFAFLSNHSSLKGNLTLTHLSAPSVKGHVSINGTNNVMDLFQWLEYPTWHGSKGSIEGSIDWDNTFSSMDEFSDKGLWGGNWHGKVDVKNAYLQVEGAAKPTLVPEATMELDGQDLIVSQASIGTGTTFGQVHGSIKNFFNDQRQHFDMVINGSEWVADDIYQWEIWEGDFTGSSDDEAFEDTYAVALKVNNLRMGDVTATNLSGNIRGEGLHAVSEDFRLAYSNGQIAGKFEWLPTANDHSQLGFNGTVEHIDLRELMVSMDNFQQEMITADQLGGIISARIELVAPFNANNDFLSQEMSAIIDFQIDNGRIQHFEPLMALSRFVEVEDLQDVRFNSLKNILTIENEIVHIPEMRVENNVLGLKIAGKHRLDDYLDFRLELQIRDLMGNSKKTKSKVIDEYIVETSSKGPVWIPIKMVGSSDDLKFTLDKKALTQDVKSSLKSDWERQGEELKDILKKPTEKPSVPENKYQFEWSEEPDTNRLFNGNIRSFIRYPW